VARQFGLKIVETHPALVPLTFNAEHWAPFSALSGVSMEVDVTVAQQAGKGRKGGATTFREDLLLTHRGLSGPAILQISSFWNAGQPLAIDLLPDTDAAQWLCDEKSGSRKQLGTVLAQRLPERVAQAWCATHGANPHAPIAELPDKLLRALGAALNRWELTPSGSEGYRKAEVTRGGVDTRALSSTTMEAQGAPGLYFIGEVVDVTGWLGGYNFQWAWASAVAAGEAVSAA
ncbi:MAG: aminoacetone oxidase family FAD-binding enzyme, partial [Ralstonia mannitolilytica]